MGALLVRALLSAAALASALYAVALLLRALRGGPRVAVRCAVCGAELEPARRERPCPRCGANG